MEDYVPRKECELKTQYENEKLDQIQADIASIRDNHLRHQDVKIDAIAKRVDNLEKNLRFYGGIAVGILGTLQIINLIAAVIR